MCQRNMILGIDQKEFSMHKERYKAALEKYGLWDDEEADLGDI